MAAVKSRLVAAMTRTSVGRTRLPPTRSNCRSWSTRSNVIWVSAGSSPTSSRKIVPECASSKRPWRRCTAPVKAPFSWPNSSDAIKEEGIDAQFTLINAWPERCECLCTARAINSFPVPVSPMISTVESVGATFTILESKVCVTHPLFGSPAILNIRPSRIPANNAPVVVAKGIVADKKPAIVTVFSKRSLLKFKRLTARERLLALLAQPFQILGVEDPRALVFSLHVLQRETGVIEQCLICIKGCPIRAQHIDITGDGVGHPPKLCFLRHYLIKRSLQ